MPHRKLCTKLLLETQSAPNGHDYRITKYGENNSPISTLVDVPNSEQYDFGKPASASGGILLNPLHQKIISILAKGNSTQAAASVPKYTCQGKSKVYNQLVKNNNFADLSEWTEESTVSLSVSGNVGTMVCGDVSHGIFQTASADLRGHKIAYILDVKGEPGSETLLCNVFGASSQQISGITTSWQTLGIIATPVNVASRFGIYAGEASSTYYLRNIRICDMTPLYGAGNEPATVSAFLADYPFFSAYVAYTTGAIHSISSITLGGHTVSVDLRSAGSVYDEWASNSRGTRKVLDIDLSAQTYVYSSTYQRFSTLVPLMKVYATFATPADWVNPTGYTISSTIDSQSDGGSKPNMTMWQYNNTESLSLQFKNTDYTDAATFAASLAGLHLLVPLKTATAFTAGTPLTLASGLTPTDQDGNAVTFTESTESTPSPNYPVPIVNSSLISITDGQDTNSAAVDLAGLTDKDEVYVNVKSTNIWDEEYETGGLYASDGTDWSTSDRIRSKNYISVQGGSDYYFQIPSAYQIIVCWYDSEKAFISTTNYGYASAITAPANAAFCRFATSGSYGTTYNHDISISLGSSATPYMPHDTIGKVWKKQQVGRVDLSTLSWTLNSAGYYEAPTVSNMATTAAGGGLAEKYKVYTDFTAFTSASNTDPSIYVGASNIFVKNEWNSPTGNFYYGLTNPIWTDITSTATGAALLAMETYEGDSNTATIDNNGDIEVGFWRQV